MPARSGGHRCATLFLPLQSQLCSKSRSRCVADCVANQPPRPGSLSLRAAHCHRAGSLLSACCQGECRRRRPAGQFGSRSVTRHEGPCCANRRLQRLATVVTARLLRASRALKVHCARVRGALSCGDVAPSCGWLGSTGVQPGFSRSSRGQEFGCLAPGPARGRRRALATEGASTTILPPRQTGRDSIKPSRASVASIRKMSLRLRAGARFQRASRPGMIGLAGFSVTMFFERLAQSTVCDSPE